VEEPLWRLRMTKQPVEYLEVSSSITARPNGVAPIVFKAKAHMTEQEAIEKYTVGQLENNETDEPIEV